MDFKKEPTLMEILEHVIKRKASDFHFGENTCPAIRIDGELDILSPVPFSHDYTVRLIKENLSEERFRILEKERELDYSFGFPGLGRFRANLFYQRQSIGGAIRSLPFDPMSFDQIGFPESIAIQLATKPNGLVLVTGPTGSGKTTTLAAMIDYINNTQAAHIVTIEDPIEILFKNKKSIINQREVGSDTKSFSQALKHVLRQDPDVILIGEMRDLEAIETALMVAETGHLVFATLHTPDTVQAINRMVDVFPAHQQQQVRVQLSFVLQGLISQQLIRRQQGGVALAAEILMVTPAVRTMIRESKNHQIYSALQTGVREGMKTLNMSLAELVNSGKVSYEEALARSSDTAEFERLTGVAFKKS